MENIIRPVVQHIATQLSKIMKALGKTQRKSFDSTRTRTENLLLRRQAPYPLGHRAMKIQFYIVHTEINEITLSSIAFSQSLKKRFLNIRKLTQI